MSFVRMRAKRRQGQLDVQVYLLLHNFSTRLYGRMNTHGNSHLVEYRRDKIVQKRRTAPTTVSSHHRT